MIWVDQSKWVILTCLLISGKVLAQDPVEAIPRDDAKFLIDEHHKAQAHVDKALSSGVDLSALMCTPPSQVAFVEKSKHIKIPDSLDPTDQNLDRYRAAGVPIFDSCQVRLVSGPATVPAKVTLCTTALAEAHTLDKARAAAALPL